MTLFAKISKTNIVVIGDVMLDVYLIGEVNRISPDAPVPIVWVKQKMATLGGAGNVALNLAGLGCTVTLIGVRGNDAQGRQMSNIIQTKGITDCLIIDDGHPTTTKNRVMVQRQQIIRFDEEEIWEFDGQHKRHLLQDIEKSIAKADGVILSDYDKGVLFGDLPKCVIELCNARRIPVFVDPKRKAWERYEGATSITPNIAEMEQISGTKIGRDEKKLVEQAYKLRKLYNIEWFLATRGSDGMCLLGPDNIPFYIKSMAREVFDVSGAGDTVIATLTAAVASGLPFPIASEISNVAAGIVVGKVGSQPITMKELDAAWKNKELGLLGGNKNKSFTLDAAVLQIKTWKAMDENIVMTHGYFDLIHPGHIHNLNYAKELGDRLVVGLYNDDFIRKHKGENRPVLNQTDRVDVLSALQCVDMVIILDEEQPHSTIKHLNPDVFVKGADDLLDNLLEDDCTLSQGCKIETISCLSGHSSTVLINELLRK